MATLEPENLWFNGVQLSEGEEAGNSYPANHTQGKRAVGGKLFLTNHRLVFAPNRIDAGLGGLVWEIPVSKFKSAGIDKPRFGITEIFSGALRTRLAIHCHDGDTQYFVVGMPERVADEIENAILTKS